MHSDQANPELRSTLDSGETRKIQQKSMSEFFQKLAKVGSLKILPNLLNVKQDTLTTCVRND